MSSLRSGTRYSPVRYKVFVKFQQTVQESLDRAWIRSELVLGMLTGCSIVLHDPTKGRSPTGFRKVCGANALHGISTCIGTRLDLLEPCDVISGKGDRLLEYLARAIVEVIPCEPLYKKIMSLRLEREDLSDSDSLEFAFHHLQNCRRKEEALYLCSLLFQVLTFVSGVWRTAPDNSSN